MSAALRRGLLLSLLLHACLLAWPWASRPGRAQRADSAPLSVHLPDGWVPAPLPPDFARPAGPSARVTAAGSRVRGTDGSVGARAAAADAATDPERHVDLEDAMAQARRIAREPAAAAGRHTGVGAGAAPESVLARALQPDLIVERREADGWTVRIGGRRCLIAPVDVPHFMRGVTVVPLCEAASGR